MISSPMFLSVAVRARIAVLVALFASIGFGCRFGGERPATIPDGWVAVLDSEWTVSADGTIASDQDPGGRLAGESWLLTEKDYEDFELSLEFRIPAGGNSGVFFRDPVSRAERLAAANGGSPPWEAGYEVNINGDEPNYPTGSVWATAKGTPGLQRDDEWNTLEVRVVGQRIWTTVNGTVALDGAELPARSERGAIGFQRHGGEAYRDKRIEFRRVEIREL